MRKIELSLASNYVPEWTLVDAVRELFQNALDQEVQDPENKFNWYYDYDTLRVCNKKSVLTTQTLLLGGSSKANDDRCIGQFGEGYKIATLVLLRLGKQVTVYNYGVREVWRPRFVKSRKFGADILTFFIDKEYPWTKVPTDDLMFEVTGITEEEWQTLVVPSNLHLQDNISIKVSSDIGDVLDSERHSGMVFVEGLYVCKYDQYKYGYNFRPGLLKLDRDRKLASDFDLKWLASRLWCLKQEMAVDLLEEGLADVAYVADMTYSIGSTMYAQAYNRFSSVHGPRAVPVTTQAEADKVPKGYKAVIVSDAYKRIIQKSDEYSDPEPDEEEQAVLDRLSTWYNNNSYLLPEDQQSMFYQIFEQLKEEIQ